MLLEFLYGLLSLKLLLVVAVVLFVVFVHGTSTFGELEKVGVPHPKPWPMIGNADIFFKGFFKDTTLMKKYGKIFGMYEFRRPVIVFCDPKLVPEICVKQFDHFINRRTAGFPIYKELRKAVSLLKGLEWKGMRSVISPTFSGSKMKKMTPLIQECAEGLVEHAQKYAESEDQIIEVRNLFGCYTMDVIASTAFGTKVNSQKEGRDNEFVKHARSVFEDLSIFDPVLILCFLFPSLSPLLQALGFGIMKKATLVFFRDNLHKILDMRAKQTKKPVDFLQLMLDAHEMDTATEDEDTKEANADVADQDWRAGKRALSYDEIVANAMTFFMVGYETTGSAMSWLLYEMALNPDIQERLYKEICHCAEMNNGVLSYDVIIKMEYLDQVFSETLRLWPAAQRTERVCEEDSIIGGIPIKKDQIIYIGIWAMHHDEDYWNEPLKFDPERFSPENKDRIVPYSYMPFGVGPRNCVGMRLAILEAKLGIAAILRKYRFSPCEKTKRNPTLKKGGLTTPEGGIHLKIEKR